MKMMQRPTQLEIIRAAGEKYGQAIAKKRSKHVRAPHIVPRSYCDLPGSLLGTNAACLKSLAQLAELYRQEQLQKSSSLRVS